MISRYAIFFFFFLAIFERLKQMGSQLLILKGIKIVHPDAGGSGFDFSQFQVITLRKLRLCLIHFRLTRRHQKVIRILAITLIQAHFIVRKPSF